MTDKMSNIITKQKNISNLEDMDNKFDVNEIICILWRGKWLIITTTIIFAICALVFAIKQPNIYKSQAMLAPAETEHNDLAGLSGQFGGLANLVGINLGSSKNNKSQLAIEVMKSHKFISNFIQEHKILPDLMAAKKWDLDTNNITYNQEVYDSETKTWVRKVNPPYKIKPSMQEAYKQFMKIFSVSSNKDTGIIIVSVEHVSPYLAQQWVKWIVVDINKVMKQRDVSEAVRGQEFLEEQLRKTNVADMRTVLYQLMEQAAKTIMFANVRDEYVFKTIDPAFVPEEKFKPKRALICIIGTLLGGILGVSIVIFYHGIKNIK